MTRLARWAAGALLSVVAGFAVWVSFILVEISAGIEGNDARLAALETRQAAQEERDVVAETPPREATDTAAIAQLVASLGGRVDDLERLLEQVNDRVSMQAVVPGAPVNPYADLAAAASPTEIDLSTDLEAAFSNESASTEWGEAARASINEAFFSEYTNRPFYLEYGGQVVTECRGTVCKIDWLLSPSVVHLGEQEKADLLEQGKFELLALATTVSDGGKIMTTPSLSGKRPHISVLIEKRKGGDANLELLGDIPGPQLDLPVKGVTD
ncbi:MAG: hypothetical protein LJE61_04860 [Thiocapsa sp.]|nr:hypothetical protein [Thiocapsa sp.]MCG6984524.1 hypothetical protein [Thiocapsa sp.]